MQNSCEFSAGINTVLIRLHMITTIVEILLIHPGQSFVNSIYEMDGQQGGPNEMSFSRFLLYIEDFPFVISFVHMYVSAIFGWKQANFIITVLYLSRVFLVEIVINFNVFEFPELDYHKNANFICVVIIKILTSNMHCQSISFKMIEILFVIKYIHCD